MTNYAAAMQSNRVYARQLRWGDRFTQIAIELGFANISPDERQFVDAIVGWQRRHGMPADGIVGPATWRILEPLTRFTAHIGRPPLPPPDWFGDMMEFYRSRDTYPSSVAACENGEALVLQPGTRGRNILRRRPIRDCACQEESCGGGDSDEGRNARRERCRWIMGLGRTHALLLYLCEEFATTLTQTEIRALPVAVGDHHGRPEEEIAAMLAFAEARDDGLVGRAGMGWTSFIPKRPEYIKMSMTLPNFDCAFDRGYGLQREEIYRHPIIDIARLCAQILVEALLAELGARMLFHGALTAVRAGRLGALTIRNSLRQIERGLRHLQVRLFPPRSKAEILRLISRPGGWEAIGRLYPGTTASARGAAAFEDLRLGQFVIRTPNQYELQTVSSPGSLEQPGAYILSSISGNLDDALTEARRITNLGREQIRDGLALSQRWVDLDPRTRELRIRPGNPVVELKIYELEADVAAVWSVTGPQLEGAVMEDASLRQFRPGGWQQLQLPNGWQGRLRGRVPVPTQ